MTDSWFVFTGSMSKAPFSFVLPETTIDNGFPLLKTGRCETRSFKNSLLIIEIQLHYAQSTHTTAKKINLNITQTPLRKTMSMLFSWWVDIYFIPKDTDENWINLVLSGTCRKYNYMSVVRIVLMFQLRNPFSAILTIRVTAAHNQWAKINTLF